MSRGRWRLPFRLTSSGFSRAPFGRVEGGDIVAEELPMFAATAPAPRYRNG